MSALTPEEALAAWAAARRPGPAREPEVVRVDDALGRVAAVAVRARRSSPAFPAAAMDGIAVCAADAAAIAVIDVAERETGVAVARGNPLGVAPGRLDAAGLRVVAGPARAGHAPPGALAARTDAAAVDAVVLGHADCALVACAPARAAGLEALTTGRARVALAFGRDAREEDPALATLLAVLGSPDLDGALVAEEHEPAAHLRSPA